MYLFRLVYYSRNIVKTLGQPVSSEIKSILNSAAKNNPSLGLTGALIFNDAYFAQVLEGDRKAVTATFCKIAGDPRHSDLVIMKAEPIEQRTFLRWSMAFAGHSDDIDPLYVKYGIAIGFNPAKMTSDNLLGFVTETVARDPNVITSKFDGTADQTQLLDNMIAEAAA
ncbi:MAG: BLUF domain-containing protein [Hyphomicrobiales bacterium]|nr:BLUF domain-containing protein [Hyphomicrobiales bacterium]